MPLTFIGRSKNKIAVPTVTNERQQYASGRLACQKCTRRRRREATQQQEKGIHFGLVSVVGLFDQHLSHLMHKIDWKARCESQVEERKDHAGKGN